MDVNNHRVEIGAVNRNRSGKLEMLNDGLVRSYGIGTGLRNDEVVGSIPTSSTIPKY